MLLVGALAATCGSTLPDQTRPEWTSPGLIGGAGWPYEGRPMDLADAAGASYLYDTSVVLLGNGKVRLVPPGGDKAITVDRSNPLVAAAERGDHGWLADGLVPGTGTAYRDMSVRALLDLRLLTRANGASTASWYGAWRYVWPRDSAFTVAAFTATGHDAEARRILRFLARAQTPGGMWAARYHADGSPVLDGRRAQLDSLGWVLWATWFFQQNNPERPAELWPMVRRAGDRLLGSLDAEGLPPPSSDYFERSPSTEQDPHRPTLGVVGPVLTGLRAATAIAQDHGHSAEAQRWRLAAGRLSAAIARQFAPYGYPRSPIHGGRMDTSVNFLAPPFAPATPGVTAAIANAGERLRLPNGGVLPGEQWAGNKTVAWTPEMALFALSAAAGGRSAEAGQRLDWLSAHRTVLGVLPEKVDQAGRAAAVAPLGWTSALVVLTLSARERPLPIPPA